MLHELDLVLFAAVVEARHAFHLQAHLAADATTRRISRRRWFGSRWIGMKSSTSTTPSGVMKRVIRTFVSGK